VATCCAPAPAKEFGTVLAVLYGVYGSLMCASFGPSFSGANRLFDVQEHTRSVETAYRMMMDLTEVRITSAICACFDCSNCRQLMVSSTLSFRERFCQMTQMPH